MPSCTDLLQSHLELASRMQHHLEAVVTGNLDSARHHFLGFAALLDAHSRSEDEILIPAFVEADLETLGCSADLLHKEHRKLRRLVADAHRRVFDPAVSLDATTRIEWVEAMHMLKEVLEHHDLRERSAFHPSLDQALGVDRASALALRALQREQELESDWLDTHPT